MLIDEQSNHGNHNVVTSDLNVIFFLKESFLTQIYAVVFVHPNLVDGVFGVMEGTIFPPSPSWFLPNIIATRDDGSVCYGAKNSVVILKLINNKKTDISIIQDAHTQRVTAVAFSPSSCCESVQNSVVSSSEDGFVKLWNLDTLKPTVGHRCHKEQNGDVGKIVSLDWSLANPNHIVSAADNNTLALWDVFSNTTIKFSFQKLGPTVLSCCPYNEKIIAVGSKTGQIYVINLKGNGEVVYKLRGHDNKIHSLSWCPVHYNVFKINEIHEEFLLASGCQNKEVLIWRVGSDGKCEAKFHIPTSALSKRDSQYYGKIGNCFSYVALCWLEPYKLYLSSNFGELIYFDIRTFVFSNMSGGCSSGQKVNKHLGSFRLGHCFHTKGLYAIAGSPVKAEVVLSEKLNIESELQFSIQSNFVKIIRKADDERVKSIPWEVIVSKSSSLLWTSGQDRKLVACELKLNKTDLVFNYHTMNGFVYCAVVSPHDPNKVAIGVGDGMIRLWNLTDLSGDIQIHWQKIKDRVMSLNWHPKKDGLLAYGTSEGRVGLVDTKSNKLPTVFKPYHSQPIYSLSWGPQFLSKEKLEFDLYCIGDNTLSVYNTSKLNVDPLNLSQIILFPCKKQTDVCWKPDYSLMAVGNEDGSICLIEALNFQIIYTVHAYKKLIQSIAWHPCSTSVDLGISPYHGYFTSGSADNECEIRVFHCVQLKNKVQVELVAKLKGHHGHIQSVSWSPHISGQLVSTSVDYSVQIWDVVSQIPLVNFTPTGMPLFSMWSPVDPDIIFTGCRNDVLYVWRISAQTQTLPAPKTKKQKKERNLQMSVSKELVAGDNEIIENPKNKQTEIMSVAEVKTAVKSSKEPKMFSKIWKGDDELKTCYLLLKNEKEHDYSLSFLCHNDYFKESIAAEEESLKKANNWTEACELALWSGNFKDILQAKITSGQLNDFLVSLAPTVSPRIWQEACLSYSKTLAEKKFYRKAATYLIICHKIYEAIFLLMDANLFLEALCIARSRLLESDPILKEIIKKYADWLFKNGSFLKACECYIYLKEYLEVAQICGKKSQPEYLSLAALAAKKFGACDLEAVESTNAIFKCLETHNFELAQQVCSDHQNLKHLNLIFFVYNTIHQLNVGELELKKDIILYIRRSFKTEDVIFPSFLPKLYHKYAFYKDKRQVFIIVTQELSFAACAKNIEETVTHLTKALSTCSRYVQNSDSEVHPLYKLCCWLSPEGFLSPNSFFSLSSALLPFKIKSLRAFLCASIVRHLNNNQKPEIILKNLELVNKLKEDLLDSDSYKYFQNLIVIEIAKKRLIKNRYSLSKTKANGRIGNGYAEKNANAENDNLESSEKVSELKKIDDGVLESSDEVKNQDETDLKNYGNYVNKSTSYEVHSIQYDEIDCVKSVVTVETFCTVETESEKDLEEKVKEDLEIIDKLTTEIENFEALRVSSPNPVPVYFMLKKLCEEVHESESAKILLKELEKKWQELN